MSTDVLMPQMGESIAEGVDYTEGLVVADLDPAVVADVRDRFRFLPDRRN